MQARRGVAFAAVAVMVGCAGVEVQEKPRAAIGEAPGETIAVLLLPRQQPSGRDVTSNEDEFAGCIGRAIQATHPRLRVIPPSEFRSNLYPWFQASTTPSGPEEMASVLSRPEIRDRIDALRVRYLITLGGASTEDDWKGRIEFFSAPGAAGWLGLKWQDVQSVFQGAVWDLKAAKLAGHVEASAAGRSWMPAMILPFPIIARPEGRVCDELGQRLAQLLADRDAHQDQVKSPPP